MFLFCNLSLFLSLVTYIYIVYIYTTYIYRLPFFLCFFLLLFSLFVCPVYSKLEYVAWELTISR